MKLVKCESVSCGDHGHCDIPTGKCKCDADTYGETCQYSK